MAGRSYGYARCSTTEKRQDVERQVAELRAMGAEFVVQEYESGANPDRQGLRDLLGSLEVGDELIATEVSRVTRSLLHLCEIMEAAKAKNVRMRFGPAVFECAGGRMGPFDTAMLQMMGVFAELERNLAAERINSGLAHARASGVRLGRPKKTAADVPASFRAQHAEWARGGAGMGALAKRAGVSMPTARKYARLLDGERRGEWHGSEDVAGGG